MDSNKGGKMAKLVTKLPEDIYGDDKWAILFGDYDSAEAWMVSGDNLPRLNEAVFVHWSLLTDRERDSIRFEWLMEEPNETL